MNVGSFKSRQVGLWNAISGLLLDHRLTGGYSARQSVSHLKKTTGKTDFFPKREIGILAAAQKPL